MEKKEDKIFEEMTMIEAIKEHGIIGYILIQYNLRRHLRELKKESKGYMKQDKLEFYELEDLLMGMLSYKEFQRLIIFLENEENVKKHTLEGKIGTAESPIGLFEVFSLFVNEKKKIKMKYYLDKHLTLSNK